MSLYLGIRSCILSLISRRPSVIGSLDTSLCRLTVGRQCLTDDFWGDVLRLLRRWETPLIGAFAPHEMPFFFWSSDLFLLSYFAVKARPELESKFEEQVQAAIKYARTIDDFDELIDPRTLARHCLGPEPSLYVLSTLDREERKRKLSLHMG